MRIFILFVTISLSLNAQSAFSDGKIDTHGGKSSSYGNGGMYQQNFNGKSAMGLSGFLEDKKANKENKEKSEEKSSENTKSKKAF